MAEKQQDELAAETATATALFMQQMPKRQLAQLARTHGWRGDDARTSKFQIALYCAQKGLNPEASEGSDSQPSGGGSGSGSGGKESEGMKPNDGGAGGSEEGAKGEGQGDSGAQGEGGEGKGDGEADEQGDGGEQSDGADAEQGKDGKGDKGEPKQGDKGEPGDGEQQQEQPQQPEPEKAPNNKEWKQMLADAKIDRPHLMLRKVHALAVVAKVHVMLVGPAGCGKTMLAGQLAQLLGYTFSLNSMTAGTSESALTGWLLPVGENGQFVYVPAPLVQAYKNGKAVHLLDETDASDQNLLLVLNAMLANGHFPIPHNLKEPMVKRSDTCILMAACNTTGGGADDLYTGRTALDASTLDRFYMVRVDYAADYEATLFDAAQPTVRGWTPTTTPPDYAAAHAWTVALRQKVNSLKIPRIVSTRFFQKVRATLDAGLSFKEIKSDLLMAWSPDELRRAGEMI